MGRRREEAWRVDRFQRPAPRFRVNHPETKSHPCNIHPFASAHLPVQQMGTTNLQEKQFRPQRKRSAALDQVLVTTSFLLEFVSNFCC